MGTNIAASRAISRYLPVSCRIIPNPYDAALFSPGDEPLRHRDIAFVGRLVSEKGADLLIAALRLLPVAQQAVQLTIIGDGPERSRLEQLAARAGVLNHVRFTGFLSQEQVARELRQHKVLVVPSLSEEPFGVVALEGAACGCMVLGSDGGGLPEAIGPTGRTFRRGDVSDLARHLLDLLLHPEEWSPHRKAAPAHLEHHQPKAIAARYLDTFRCALIPT